MFGPKKPAQSVSKPNPVDVLLKKISALPPSTDLMVASAIATYAIFAIYFDDAKFIGLVCMLLALLFAMMGINAVVREMKNFKLIEAHCTPDLLRAMKHKQLEQFLVALFSLNGYQVRSAIGEMDRYDDVDLIATKKKEKVLIQFNHFNEDRVDIKPVESLLKAATAFEATSCIAITFGTFTNKAIDWCQRKEVRLMSIEDLLNLAADLTGKTQAETHPAPPIEVQVEQSHEIAEICHGHHRYLFVDLTGLHTGITLLSEILDQHPAYRVVISSTGMPIEQAKSMFAHNGDRIIGTLPLRDDGRYFSILAFLATQPEGKDSTWLALDTIPREYPEGCSELVAINRAFGFDTSAAQRLVDAMILVDKRKALHLQNSSIDTGIY